ncbi:hypothetical protein [Actinacidiphila glaucinigra]|uniref:hypothetical protein n=1 Tax=Actinacidiphila glaucinigra TaxID=235986 RepID=UPI0036ED6255
MIGLFGLVFPVFAVALVRAGFTGAAGVVLGRAGGGRMGGPYPRLLPSRLKVFYRLVVCVFALALVTGCFDDARDAKADAHGYYYTEWNDRLLRSERVPLTETEYDMAVKDRLRILSAQPALFNAVSSLLVLASATAARATGAHRDEPGRHTVPRDTA